MESGLREISLPVTTEKKPEIVPNNSPAIIQIPLNDFPLKERLKLQNCGIPEEVVKVYSQKGIDTMLEWQLECLSKPEVLSGNKNLIVSAPTSAGKSLVGEIIALKCILEKKKKVMIVQPFVAAVHMTEKHLQDILKSYRVQGFLESFSPSGGISKTDVTICTIERADILLSKMLQEDQENLGDIGIIIVDELHMVGDKQRGYHLELLLSKVLYMEHTESSTNIQLVGLSEGLENDKEVLTRWFNGASFYSTKERPVPLHQKVKMGRLLFDTNFKENKKLDGSKIEGDQKDILQISKDILSNGDCVLVFCATRNNCEDLALKLAEALPESMAVSMKTDLANFSSISDEDLKTTIPKGIAFHHAGLSSSDREAIEDGFVKKNIKLLVATTTLSSSVNLPVRLVIVTSPYDYSTSLMNFRTYKQMVGRAGRKGLDEKGESILICSKSQRFEVQEWLQASYPPISSALISEDSTMSHNIFHKKENTFTRILLNLIYSGINSEEAIQQYSRFTLHYHNDDIGVYKVNMKKSLNYLLSNGFIKSNPASDATDNKKVFSTSDIGSATAWSSLPPEEALALHQHLKRKKAKEFSDQICYTYLVSFIYGVK